jgi:hypothetical protein
MDEESSYYKETLNWSQNLVGKVHVFPDGNKLEIIQTKIRDTGLWVTYLIHDGPGIPRKLVMHVEEFRENFGHLFGDEYYEEDF